MSAKSMDSRSDSTKRGSGAVIITGGLRMVILSYSTVEKWWKEAQ